MGSLTISVAIFIIALYGTNHFNYFVLGIWLSAKQTTDLLRQPVPVALQHKSTQDVPGAKKKHLWSIKERCILYDCH